MKTKHKFIIASAVAAIAAGIWFLLFSYNPALLTYKNGLFRYTVRYPASFTVSDIGGGGIVSFISPRSNENDIFFESINIIVQNFGSNSLTLNQYYKATREALEEPTSSTKVAQVKKIRLKNKQEAYALLFSTLERGVFAKCLQTIFVHRNKGYIITYVAMPDEFERYVADARLITNSFRLLDR
ncbi:MAG: hypothetical protein C4540_03195 [Candidatus Omnitrophota bacterium]|jgi:serine/threonine-protein kinase|nr:MAG: hypothetical protein C4540_03195 [Candidatus Omnitrophota bacterium]